MVTAISLARHRPDDAGDGNAPDALLPPAPAVARCSQRRSKPARGSDGVLQLIAAH
jgi:hypothetical protein